MIPCISVENMRQSDAYTIANHVPGQVLMHRAAMGVFLSSAWEGDTAIVTGSGNNGGDGFALACILKKNNGSCTVFALSEPRSEDSVYYASQARAMGVSVVPFTKGCLRGVDRVVDCLLGTGFQGEVRPCYGEAIDEINGSGLPVISVDINSGMNGDTGAAVKAVRSGLTVAIGFVKQGMVTKEAGRWIKRLVCVDIGIELQKQEGWILSEAEMTDRKDTDGDPGHILCPPWVDMKVILSRG